MGEGRGYNWLGVGGWVRVGGITGMGWVGEGREYNWYGGVGEGRGYNWHGGGWVGEGLGDITDMPQC